MRRERNERFTQNIYKTVEFPFVWLFQLMCLLRCSPKGLNSTYWHSETQFTIKRILHFKYIQKWCVSFYFIWTQHWLWIQYRSTSHLHISVSINHYATMGLCIPDVHDRTSFTGKFTASTSIRKVTQKCNLDNIHWLATLQEWAWLVCTEEHWSPDWQLSSDFHCIHYSLQTKFCQIFVSE